MTVSPSEHQLLQIRKLTEVSRAITYAVSLEELFQLTVDRSADLLGSKTSLLLLANDDGILTLRASHGIDVAIAKDFRAPFTEVFLPHLAGWNAARREAAVRYGELGLGELVELPVDEPGHVYHMYVVRTPRRAEIADALRAAGIACASYYVTPTHLQPAMAYLGVAEASLPETERAAAENLALPMWGGIDPEQQERVVDAVRSVAGVPA